MIPYQPKKESPQDKARHMAFMALSLPEPERKYMLSSLRNADPAMHTLVRKELEETMRQTVKAVN